MTGPERAPPGSVNAAGGNCQHAVVLPLSAEVIAPSLARPEDQARFRVSVFATGLGLLARMAQLADGLVCAPQGNLWLQHNGIDDRVSGGV